MMLDGAATMKEASLGKRLARAAKGLSRAPIDDYMDLLRRKVATAPMRGLSTIPPLASHLFPFQRHCVEFLLKVGSGGCFLSTGLGKTLIELEWLKHAGEAMNGRTLLLTPLAVARQIEREARRFGYDARVIREQDQAADGINICNYDRLDKLDPTWFGAVALDESSIIKQFTGTTTRKLIEMFAGHRFRLAATATPAPNDHMELGTHAEFLGIMSQMKMLSRFFINDTGKASQEWRLKGHAEAAFWDWMATWSRAAEMPSDLGDSDERFILPPLQIHRHRTGRQQIKAADGDLFGAVEMSATGLHEVKRATIGGRAALAASLIERDGEPWVVWCDTNYEADALMAAIPDAVEVRGSMSIEDKETQIEAFASGQTRVILGKPSMLGHGLNWQHCNRMVFVGRGFSYEQWFQAVRRCWRFGQTRPVDVHLIVAEGEDEIGRVIDRKSDDHKRMLTAMRDSMRRGAGIDQRSRIAYEPNHDGSLPRWFAV